MAPDGEDELRAAHGTVWLFSVAGALSMTGCGEAPPSPEPDRQQSPAVASSNGLAAINGLNAHNGLDTINGLSVTNGLNAHNGLAAINGLNAHNGLAAINGLNAHNGLAAVNGLNGLATGTEPTHMAVAGKQSAAIWQPPQASNDLMTSAEGRTTMSYIVRCALPSGHSVTMNDQNGTSYTYEGRIGIAPQWETGACDTDCQEYMTACLLAHVNTSGQHISLWLDSASPAIGWGRDANFPYQEGTFYGNIFQSPPKAYYCDGQDHAFGVVPGRLGANQTNSPYTNPLGKDVLCKDRCTAAGGTNGNDGFSSCPGIAVENFTHIVTVYRNFDPSTMYKIRRGTELRQHVLRPEVDRDDALARPVQRHQLRDRAVPQLVGLGVDASSVHGRVDPAVELQVDGGRNGIRPDPAPQQRQRIDHGAERRFRHARPDDRPVELAVQRRAEVGAVDRGLTRVARARTDSRRSGAD